MHGSWAAMVFGVAVLALALGPSAQSQQGMTFFVTSVGSGNGADLGGLAGADAHCQQLAQQQARAGPGAPISARRPRMASRR